MRFGGFFSLLFLAAGLFAADPFAGYAHPERYAPVTEKLEAAGVSKERIAAIFGSPRGRERDEKAVELAGNIRNIPVFKKREKKANDRFLKEIPFLVQKLEEHEPAFSLAEKRYGVNREIVAAILQKETALGRYNGFGHDAFTALNSLLDGLEVNPAGSEREKKRTARLIRMAENNLAALLVYLEQHGRDVTAERFPSSYTGAIGYPQFMPVNLGLADAFHGEKPDLMNLDDAILSVASYFRGKGRWPEKPLDFREVPRFDAIMAGWEKFDDGNASFAYEENLEGMPLRCYALNSPFPAETAYLRPYVKGVMSYNFSSEYAIGILKIARLAWKARNEPVAQKR